MDRKTISRLVHDHVCGTLSEADRQLLKQWLTESTGRQEAFNRLMDEDLLAQRYEQYAQVDDEQAWKTFRQQHFGKKTHRIISISARRSLRYAAAIVILIIGSAAWWYNDYTHVTPPEIPADVQIAMQMSRESGKMEAETSEVGDEKMRGERNASSAENTSLTSHPSPLTSDVSDLLSARRITTRHDKEYWVTLDDGTLVHLNYNTHLIYPEKFGRKNRTVILDGEAYFMVAKDRSRAFIVHTPNGDVKVYGTEFNVNTRTLTSHPSPLTSNTSSMTTTVVLVHGSVSVTPTDGKEQLLKPGQQATFNPQNSTFNVQDVDVEPYVAWNTGKFDFRKWPLKRIMDVLGRWYGYKVEYASDSLRQVTLSGDFDRYEDITTTLEALATVTELKFTVRNRTIFIK